MSGYTPVFDTVFTGTLHGRWPDTGLWLCLLAMQNKHGEIDCTPQYISSVTGLPVEEVQACIKRFMEPDEYSRSPDAEGRRLVPIDASRPWGWIVVNHATYREKARLQAKSAREVESGSNGSRMNDRRRPPETAGNITRPPITAADPLSNANADSSSGSKNSRRKTRAVVARRVPTDFSPDLDLARRDLPGVDAEREAQKFRDHEFKHPRSDWSATWRTWVQTCRESGRYAKLGNGSSEWR